MHVKQQQLEPYMDQWAVSKLGKEYISAVYCHLAYSFLHCAKAFKFNQVPFAYFFFYFHYSGRWVIEDPAVIYVRECFSMFSSRSFIVSGLTLRSLIHFEFTLVCHVRKCSSFILLQVVEQFSQHHLLKRLSFLHCIFLPPLSKIICPQVH